MSRKFKYFLMVLVVLVLALFLGYQKLNADLEGLKDNGFETLKPNEWKEGSYLGEANQFPIKVKVEVSIESNRITDITLIEHQTGEGQGAEAILDDVLSAQSLDVDVITGATYSSILILEAIEDALEKANE
ncbi:MAG TPA: FMN-binding protein [Erysipelotrichaceae bacterium]|nr:FMN-binding protein [Erysipelotrichaceae bacterium]